MNASPIVMFGGMAGGIGRTTSATLIAMCLTDRGRRCLLIDAGRGSVGHLLQITDGDHKPSMPDVLKNKCHLTDVVVPCPGTPNLHLVLGGLCNVYRRRLQSRPNRDAKMIHSQLGEIRNNYDVVLIDTCKSGEEQQAMLSIADYVVIPTSFICHSTDGLFTTMRDVLSVRQARNPKLRVLGAIPWAIDPKWSWNEPYAKVTELSLITRHDGDGELFKTRVISSKFVSTDYGVGRTVLQAWPNCTVSKQIRRLAVEIEERLALRSVEERTRSMN